MRAIFSNSGATTVEFAVIALLLLTLIFGVIDFGLLLYNRQVITNAAREGARRGIIVKIPRVTVTEIQNKVLEYCQNNLVTGGSSPGTALKQPTVSYEDVNGNSLTDRGDILAVEVEYTYDFFVISYLGIGPKKLKAEVKMIME